MGFDIKAIDTIANYAKSSGVKFCIKPPEFNSKSFEGLKILKKDVVNFQQKEPMHFYKSELNKINQILQDFYKEKILPVIKPKMTPTVSICPEIEGYKAQGFASAIENKVYLMDNVLLDSDFNKLVDKTTGKCIQSPEQKWQITGNHNQLNGYIEEYGLKNTEIVPLCRQERLNVLKSSCLHEVDHLRQIENQLMHPNIGPTKFFNEITKTLKEKGLSDEDISKVIEYSKDIWKPVIDSDKKILRNSSLGKKTLNQFFDQNALSREEDPRRLDYMYNLSAHERETYRKEFYFNKKLGIALE